MMCISNIYKNSINKEVENLMFIDIVKRITICEEFVNNYKSLLSKISEVIEAYFSLFSLPNEGIIENKSLNKLKTSESPQPYLSLSERIERILLSLDNFFPFKPRELYLNLGFLECITPNGDLDLTCYSVDILHKQKMIIENKDSIEYCIITLKKIAELKVYLNYSCIDEMLNHFDHLQVMENNISNLSKRINYLIKGLEELSLRYTLTVNLLNLVTVKNERC